VKILAVIANYGTKNERYLLQLLEAYRSMKHRVDIAVLSNISKDFGPDVEVIVGLPDPDPWSLPFGYKTVMNARRNDYDLFIYTEDDTLITEDNISAFLDLTKFLNDDEIAGFMRYEIGPDNQKYYSTIHGSYFWDPRSIRRRGHYTLAHYTNDHSGGFILTAPQLKKCLDSGGFMQGVRKGRYDMLCTAATDPYTQCGMQKLVPVSHLERFLLAHLPNVYLGRIGIRAEELAPQLNKMAEMAGSGRTSEPLFETRAGLDTTEFDKQYYEPCRTDLIELTAPHAQTFLSIGCGWGKTEAGLLGEGKRVTAIPLDEVIGASAAARGIETIESDFEAAFGKLDDRRFDCIIIHEILEHLSDPQTLLNRLASFLAKNGQLIVSLHHIGPIRGWWRRLREDPIMKQLNEISNFSQFRFQILSPEIVCHWMKRCGLKNINSKLLHPDSKMRYTSLKRQLLNRLWAQNIIILAEK